jgi:N-acetylglucosamine-6-phosphate deacetylase
MSNTNRLQGNILTSQGWLRGAVNFGERVDDIKGDAVDPATNSDQYILPGFIDLHVHGGGGRDVMDAGEAVHTMTRIHARHGTTSLLATTMTAPLEDLERALAGIADAYRSRRRGTSRVLGVHLEGPYINRGKLGAQPDYVQTATLAQIEQLNAVVPLKVITLAPEVAGHFELLRALKAAGIRVQIGHSTGTYEEGVAALENGVSGFTHLFNAMSTFQHRAPGMAGAALAHAEYAELIPDLLHVHPGAIRAALRAIPRLYCVTDSTAAAGMPDGEYMLGRQTVHKCMGGVRLADGTLAGSTLTMDQALRNLVSIGLDLADASRRVSTYVADYLGLQERGRIASGSMADFVVLDRELNLKSVYVEGEEIDLIDA